MDRKTRQDRGFTLIEVVLALVVFSAGVLVLLQAVTHFIGVGDEMRKRAQATLLAKEAIDIIYNQRDTNLRKGVVWNCAKINIAMADACERKFLPGDHYIVGFDTQHGYKIEKEEMQSEVVGASEQSKMIQIPTAVGTLYTHSALLPTVDPQQVSTPFTREISIEKVTISGTVLSPEHTLKVIVKMRYMGDNPDRLVVLESLLSAGEKTTNE